MEICCSDEGLGYLCSNFPSFWYIYIGKSEYLEVHGLKNKVGVTSSVGMSVYSLDLSDLVKMHCILQIWSSWRLVGREPLCD